MYKELCAAASRNEKVSHWMRIGFCRRWSDEFSLALKSLAEENGLKIKVELREVQIDYNLDHTFVRIEIAGEEPWLCDGVGVGKYKPFFGLEIESPGHLKNSRLDMIEVYRRKTNT